MFAKPLLINSLFYDKLRKARNAYSIITQMSVRHNYFGSYYIVKISDIQQRAVHSSSLPHTASFAGGRRFPFSTSYVTLYSQFLHSMLQCTGLEP